MFGMDAAVVLSLLMLLTNVLCWFQSLQSLWWYLTSDGCVPCYFYESCIVLACWTWHFVTCGIRYGCQPLRTRFKIFIPGCWNKLRVLCNTFIPLHCYYLVHCCSSNDENFGKNNLVLNLSWLPAIMTEFIFWFSIALQTNVGIVCKIKSLQLPSPSFPLHYSQTFLSHCEIWDCHSDVADEWCCLQCDA
jgi:hypothetical protein